jgi:hypothetical protein
MAAVKKGQIVVRMKKEIIKIVAESIISKSSCNDIKRSKSDCSDLTKK